ncbi:MAG: NOP5/NOP56 family protein [Candidatus Njordarchaeota archaeon]
MWIISSFVGFVALDDEGKVLSHKTYGYPPNPSIATSKIKDLERGICPEELKDLVSSLQAKSIKTDNEVLLSIIKKEFPEISIELVEKGDQLLQIRSRVHDFFVSIFGSFEKYVQYANEISVSLVKEKLREVGGEPDKMIIQAITLIEELTEAINAFIAHLREWYGIIFPDLGKIVDNHLLFTKIIYELGKPENFTEEKLLEVIKNEKKVAEIMDALKTSAIVKITDEDEHHIKEVAELVIKMFNTRDDLEKYLEDLMEDTCPNITALVGPTIGAKLIRKAGGLRQLALKPASTIQVLGAEKALFRALRGRGTPPKHGIIFVHPLIFRAPWWQRGKIARALATKLAIAARVDYFSKEYIGDELKNEILMRIEEIKKKYPKPPPEKVKKKKKKIKLKKKKRKK